MPKCTEISLVFELCNVVHNCKLLAGCGRSSELRLSCFYWYYHVRHMNEKYSLSEPFKYSLNRLDAETRMTRTLGGDGHITATMLEPNSHSSAACRSVNKVLMC